MYPTPNKPYNGIFVKEQVQSLEDLGVKCDVFFIDGKEAKKNYITAIPKLINTLRRKKYDVIHCHHTYVSTLVNLSKIFTGKRIPTILTLHEGEILAPKEFKDKRMIKKLIYSKIIKKAGLIGVNFIITVEKRLPKVLKTKKPYKVIPVGVNVSKFKEYCVFKCRSRLNLNTHKKILFFLADPSRPEKNYELLEKSLTDVKHPYKLITAGNIKYEEMPYYMNAADILILTSKYEASPMVIKEAMACNKTVISTDVGDVKEIFEDTNGCYLTSDIENLSDLLNTFLNNVPTSEGRKRLIKLGLTQEDVAKKIFTVYREVIGEY